MALIPGNLDKMNDIEVAFDASISEQLFNKISANINALVDLAGSVAVFTSSTTWTVPENVQRIYIGGCGAGGGGGGGGGANAADNRSASGGSGGAGSSLHSLIVVDVTPNTMLTVTVGTGGTGGAGGGTTGPSGVAGSAGGNGGSTTITGFAAGELAQVIFPGASGGPGGRIAANAQITTPTNDTYIITMRDVEAVWPAGAGGKTIGGTSDSGATAPTEITIQGGTITGAVGGVGGNQVGGGVGGGGGGGGASSNFGSGGVGGRGANNGASNNVAGSAPAAGTYGAGGGGGGGGSEATSVAGQPGGAGHDGVLYIAW